MREDPAGELTNSAHSSYRTPVGFYILEKDWKKKKNHSKAFIPVQFFIKYFEREKTVGPDPDVWYNHGTYNRW